MSPEQKQWYALYTKPRQEFKAEFQLRQLDIDHYIPTITEVRQWSDRKKKITEPLIRGYVFINASERERLSSLELPSIVRCVTERSKPAIIPGCQIDNLKKFIKENIHYEIFANIVKGSKIRITAGSFKDVEGIVMEEPTGKTLAVTIDLLNRTIVTYISDNDMVQILGENDKNN
jgi:transcription antitermination factor NusG